MKKRAYVLLLVLVVSLIFPTQVNANNSKNTNTITKEELCEVFPEYKNEIELAHQRENDVARTVSMRNVSERAVKETDEGSVYAISLYDDGSYTAARYVSYNLVGTENETDRKFVTTNGTLIISDYKFGANRMFTFNQVGFTINKNDFDRLDSFAEIGVAAVEGEDGRVVNYTARRNTLVKNETTSRLATAIFYIANDYFVFEVGEDGWGVILGEEEVIWVSIY